MDKGALSYEKYKNGDDQGFYEIVREYFDGLAAYINGIVGDFGLAEELADDALLKLALKKPDFNKKSSFKTWLYSIGRNAALDSLRKKSHVFVSIDDADGVTDGPEREYIKSERNRQLYRALEKLKPEYREVLYLSYFEDMSADDISALTRKSKGSVYTLMNRARASLKEILQKEGFDYENV
jgi:RNA polymerase sigma-70 factor (ECF subfamily)